MREKVAMVVVVVMVGLVVMAARLLVVCRLQYIVQAPVHPV